MINEIYRENYVYKEDEDNEEGQWKMRKTKREMKDEVDEEGNERWGRWRGKCRIRTIKREIKDEVDEEGNERWGRWRGKWRMR